MNKKIIKAFLLGCLILTALTNSSCSSTRNSVPTKEQFYVHEADSSQAGFMMNDSLLSIVNNADSLSIYELCSPLFANDTTTNNEANTDTIAYFRMKSDSVVVPTEMKTVLKFIVGDKNAYQENVPIAKQPFSPYIAIRFWTKDENIFLFYSFSTNQLAFATKEQILLACKIRDWYSLERWLHKILPENEYINSIINKR